MADLNRKPSGCVTPGRRRGCLPTPSTSSNCTLGGAEGRRLFVTAEQNLFALDLQG